MKGYLKKKDYYNYFGSDNIDLENFEYLFDAYDVNIYDILKKSNQYYSVCGINHLLNIFWVQEINLNIKGKDQEYKDLIKCPYCGYKNMDSWECADSDDAYQCGRCGLEFSYTREYNPTYNSYPKDQQINIINIG